MWQLSISEWALNQKGGWAFRVVWQTSGLFQCLIENCHEATHHTTHHIDIRQTSGLFQCRELSSHHIDSSNLGLLEKCHPIVNVILSHHMWITSFGPHAIFFHIFISSWIGGYNADTSYHVLIKSLPVASLRIVIISIESIKFFRIVDLRCIPQYIIQAPWFSSFPWHHLEARAIIIKAGLVK